MRALICPQSWFGVQIESDLRQAGVLLTVADSDQDLLDYLPMVGRAAILLEMERPDAAWRQLLRSVQHQKPSAAVLAICDQKRLEDEIAALATGADDVLTSRMETDEILARLARVATRRAGFSTPILRLGGLEIDVQRLRVSWMGQPIALTPSQYHILEHLVLRDGKFVEIEEFLDLLYGANDSADPQSIKVFLSHLRGRLRAGGASDVTIATVAGLGTRLQVAGQAEVECAPRIAAPGGPLRLSA